MSSVLRLIIFCNISFSLSIHAMDYSYASKTPSSSSSSSSMTLTSQPTLRHSSIPTTSATHGIQFYVGTNDAMNTVIQQTESFLGNPKQRYKGIDLDNPSSTTLLDPEMQKVHQCYLEGDPKSIKELEKQRNALDRKLHSSPRKIGDYFNGQRAADLRLLDFMDRVLWHYYMQQEPKSASGPCLSVESYSSSIGRMVPLDDKMRLMQTLAKRGEVDQLHFHERELSSQLKDEWTFGRYQLQRRLSFLRRLQQHPIAQTFYRIRTASIQEAGREVEMIRNCVNRPGGYFYVEGRYPIRAQCSQTSGQAFTQEHLTEAEKIYQSRYEYKQMVKQLEDRTKLMALFKSFSVFNPRAQAISSDFDQLYLVKSNAACIEELLKNVDPMPKSEGSGYIEQFNKTIDILYAQGFINWMDLPHIANVFAQGAADHAIEIGKDPIGYAKDIAQAHIELAKQLALFMVNVYEAGDSPFTSEHEIALYEKRAVEHMQAITQYCSQLKTTASQMSQDDWIRLCGRMALDYLVFKGLEIGVDKIRTIKLPAEVTENRLFAKLQQEIEAFGAREIELVTAEGPSFKVPINDDPSILKMTTDGPANVKNKVRWTRYRSKHQASKHLPWKKVIESTTHGPAKYKPNLNIETIELRAWAKGKVTTNGQNWKVFECEDIIGATNGTETKYMVVKNTENTIHGHPISVDDYRKWTK